LRYLLVLFLLIGTGIYANDMQLEAAIFNKVIMAITQKQSPKVYIYRSNEALQSYPGKLEIVARCKDADIVILSTLKALPEACKNKILFGTRYQHLYENRVIGAFFWQKGRPNILFYEQRLDFNHIKLDVSFNKYIEK